MFENLERGDKRVIDGILKNVCIFYGGREREVGGELEEVVILGR